MATSLKRSLDILGRYFENTSEEKIGKIPIRTQYFLYILVSISISFCIASFILPSNIIGSKVLYENIKIIIVYLVALAGTVCAYNILPDKKVKNVRDVINGTAKFISSTLIILGTILMISAFL